MKFRPWSESLEVRVTPTELVPVTAQILVPVTGAPPGTTQPFLDPRPYMTNGYSLYPRSTELISPTAMKIADATYYYTSAIPALPISQLA